MPNAMYGEYFNYPLRTQPHVKWADREFDKLSPETVMMTILQFRINAPRYASLADYEARRTTIDWECMGCAEAGNHWIGDDPEEHGRQHQMGFDFAMMWLEKNKKKDS